MSNKLLKHLELNLTECLKSLGLSLAPLKNLAKTLPKYSIDFFQHGSFIHLEAHLDSKKGSSFFGMRFDLEAFHGIEFASDCDKTKFHGLYFLLLMLHDKAKPYLNCPPHGELQSISRTLAALMNLDQHPVKLRCTLIKAPQGLFSDDAPYEQLTTLNGMRPFDPFFVDPVTELAPWLRDKSQLNHELSPEPVLFMFSDGMLLSPIELANHPYRLLLKSELKSYLEAEVSSFYDNYYHLINRHGSAQQNSEQLLSTLNKFEKTIDLCDLDLQIVWPQTGKRQDECVETDIILHQYIAWPVKRWKKLSPACLSWKVDERQKLTVTVKGEELSLADVVDWKLNSVDQTLHYLPVRKLLTRAGFFPGNQQSKVSINKLTLDQINRLQSTLASVNSRLEVAGSSAFDIQKFRLRLYVSDKENEDTRLEIEGGEEIANHMVIQNKIMREMMRQLLGGIGASEIHQGKAFAAIRNKEKRQADLKILRHEGFKKTAFLVTLDYIRAHPLEHLLKPRTTTAIIDLLDERLRSLDSNHTRLRETCSTGIINLIKKSITTWISSYHSQNQGEFVKLEDGRLAQININLCAMQNLEKVIAFLLSTLGKSVLTKSTLKSLMPLHEGRRCGLALNHQNADEFIHFALSQGIEVFANGRPIETLDESRLQARLVMSQKASDHWFDLHPEVFFDGKLLTTSEAKSMTTGGVVVYDGCYFYVDRKKIPATKWLNHFWERLKSNSSRSGSFDKNDYIRTEPSRILNILALKMAGLSVVGGPEWEKICSRFEQLIKEDQAIEVDFQNEIKRTNVPFKPFQERGCRWLLRLYELGLGGILADDMGLGKTIQAIGLFALLANRNELGSALIIVPPTLVYNWLSELQKFAPQLPVRTLCGRTDLAVLDELIESPGPALLITTYSMLQEHVERLNRVDWGVAVFDEAQYLKNLKAMRTSAARQLKANRKFCLSGTPMENHYGEFFSLIDLCVPGALGEYHDFSSTYVPARNARQKIAETDIEFLRLKTAPLVLRRTKSEILTELPEKTESIIKLDFESQQKKIYRDTALSWNSNLAHIIEEKGEAKAQIEMLTALLRLRQICSHPQTVPGTKYKSTPPKFASLVSAMQELSENEEPVIVFTTFRQTLLLLQKELSANGIFCLSITGDTPTKKRGEILETFQRSKGHVVLLMTQKVGGVGLNLTRSSYVFHIEPWWNPQVENQATDRVHRIGQKRAVQIYRYIMADSVEERIQHLKSYKAKLFDDLFANSESGEATSQQFSGRLSRKDFEFLLAEKG